MGSNESSLDLAGIACDLRGKAPQRVERLHGGRNNVVARAEWPGQVLLLKVYFRHAGDTRDRLGAEFGMLSFLWNEGVRCIPQPVTSRPERNAALYEFIEGAVPSPGAVGEDDVRQLAALLGRMWELRTKAGAAGLPAASEAHFTLASFLASLDARMERLATVTDLEARAFVASELAPQLEALRRKVDQFPGSNRELPQAERTLTPADHGFHNTLRRKSGELAFLDFEYAGWGDPAQMVANAWLQPEIPMPVALRPAFVRDTMGRLQATPEPWRRLRAVYGLMAFKWCLIMLNEFLPVGESRRAFAGEDAAMRRAAQLAKSRAQLDVVRDALSDRSWLDDLMRSRDVAVA